ncbi:hypothetical protein SLA2020_097410 [Shorea laevis]
MAPGSTAYLANTASFASNGSPLMNAIPFPLLHKELFFFFLKFHHLCKLMLLPSSLLHQALHKRSTKQTLLGFQDPLTLGLN